jgi:uncharacterized protein (TIGR03085 family)
MGVDIDLRERAELCDLFLEVGPDAPTLSGAWSTADLAAHLVVRERHPTGAPGILLGGRFEGRTEKLMARELDRHGYEGVVERVRTGPGFGPMAIRPVGRLANTIEFVVHHEDVRRPAGLGPRPDDEPLQQAVWGLLRRSAKLLVAPGHLGDTGLDLVWPGADPVRASGKGGGAVLTGDPVEILLFLYGRTADAHAVLSGDPVAIEKVQQASFGI